MRFDQTGKRVLREALSPAGAAHPQHEIAAEVQWADLLFEPHRARAPARPGLGLLGRMAARTCLFEHFRCTPRLDTVRSCVRKLLSLHRARALQAARAGAARPGFPRLWVLSPGRPEKAIRRFHLRPMRGWPAGFLRAAPAIGLRLVVLRDLPRTRDTLLLRLLGRDRTLNQAVEDLLALPEGAWERHVALPHLIAWRVVLIDNDLGGKLTEEETKLMRSTDQVYEEWKQRMLNQGLEEGLQKGRRMGLQQGLQQGLLAIYEARFGAVPEDLEAVIGRTHDADLLRRWFTLVTTAPASEISAKLLRRSSRQGRTGRATSKK